MKQIKKQTQGFSLRLLLISRYNPHQGNPSSFGTIAQIWRKGCIIRSVFLQKITDAYRKNPELQNLLFDRLLPHQDTGRFAFLALRWLQKAPEWRSLAGHEFGLSYFDGLRTLNSAANLIQAQRDYFGAHTYERVDRDRGIFLPYQLDGRRR